MGRDPIKGHLVFRVAHVLQAGQPPCDHHFPTTWDDEGRMEHIRNQRVIAVTVQLKCLRCPLANEPCVEEAFKDVTCCGFEGWVVVDHMKELNTPMGISVSTGLCNKLEEVFCCDLGTHRCST